MEWDTVILNFIQSHLRCGFLDAVMPIITALGNNGAIWLVCSAVLLLLPKHRQAGAAVLTGLALEVLCCNIVLKPFVARPRPCDVNTAIQLLIAKPTYFSFPSGHTGSAFAATGALFFSKNRLWIVSLVLSVFIGFSRLYLYVHYPSDVLAGILIGIMSGWVGNAATMCVKNRFRKRHA